MSLGPVYILRSNGICVDFAWDWSGALTEGLIIFFSGSYDQKPVKRTIATPVVFKPKDYQCHRASIHMHAQWVLRMHQGTKYNLRETLRGIC